MIVCWDWLCLVRFSHAWMLMWWITIYLGKCKFWLKLPLYVINAYMLLCTRWIHMFGRWCHCTYACSKHDWVLVTWWPSMNSWGPRHVNDGLEVPTFVECGQRIMRSPSWRWWAKVPILVEYRLLVPVAREHRQGYTSTVVYPALPVKCEKR